MKTSIRTSASRIAAAAATALVLAFGFASPAAATGTLDVQVPNDGTTPGLFNWLYYKQLAQTFTAHRTGSLDGVALWEGANGAPGSNGPAFSLQIWAVDPTQTTLTVTKMLGSYPLRSYTGTNALHTFPLSTPVQVTAGTQYAIVLVAAASFTVRWSYVGFHYPDGGMWTCCDTKGKWIAGATDTNFDFETFVTGATTPPQSNTAPTIHASQPAVQVNEGTPASNTGTYADGDGDTVSLFASAGSLTRTGTPSAGTWTWTQPASDEAPTQTVTITADDGHNPAVTTQFTVSVVAAKPTVTVTPVTKLAAATSGTLEGTPLFFTGSATAAWAGDQASLSYNWSVTKDGSPYGASGTGTSFSFTPNDEGAYLVTLSAADDSSSPPGVGQVSTTVLDVLPTAKIDSVAPAQTAPSFIVANESITFSGSFTDPGTADSHSASWDFGDGSPSATGWTVTHSYTAAKTYTVTLTVTEDEDKGTNSTTTTVTVQTPSQALAVIASYVSGLSDLNAGQKNSLIVKLDAASDSLARADNKTASNQLHAFLNEVRADANSGKLTPTEAANLTDAAHTVEGALGTYNRFLEWWPLAV